jgi:hypothetical protein
MAKKVALSTIRHGKEDGEVVVFEVGDSVTGLDKETMLELEAAGSVGPEPQAAAEAQEDLAASEAARQTLEKQVEELQQQLAAAELKAAEAKNTSTGAGK